MEQTSHEFKYQKHSEKQYGFILSVAEKLFIEQGIDKISIADITTECGIMRSTFYRYFKNKEQILWHIMRRNTDNFSNKLVERFETNGGTTYDRYQIFIDIIYEVFINNPDIYLFIDLFNDTYQYVTSSNDHTIYDDVYTNTDFRSGDTVRFLMDNFHDGSVNPDLDPKTTAVTITYSAISIVVGMSKQIKTLPQKYGVNAQDVVRISLNSLLTIIAP